MIVENGNAANFLSLARLPRLSHETTHAQTEIAANGDAAKVSVPISDQIALSLATKLLQQTADAGDQIRLERILQLKTAIVKEQYSYDPLAVGRALIEAHLRGL